MSQKNIVLVAIAAVLVLAGAGAAWFFLRPASEHATETASAPVPGAPAPAGGPPGKLPEPRIGVLDRSAILQYSKVGQDITKQMQVFTDQARSRLMGTRQSLENEAKRLQDAGAGMTAEARQKQAESLQARERSYQEAAAREENTLKTAMAFAHNEVSKVMEPILTQIVTERRVNMVLDKAAVPVASSPEFDLTADVIAQLDARMSSYKVSLNPAKPAGNP